MTGVLRRRVCVAIVLANSFICACVEHVETSTDVGRFVAGLLGTSALSMRSIDFAAWRKNMCARNEEFCYLSTVKLRRTLGRFKAVASDQKFFLARQGWDSCCCKEQELGEFVCANSIHGDSVVIRVQGGRVVDIASDELERTVVELLDSRHAD